MTSAVPVVPLALLAAVLVLAMASRPAWADSRAGKILAFLAFLAVPTLVTTLGAASHLEGSKSTEFCLSCHEMVPYGESLAIDEPEALPASHFQNRRVSTESACYDCHTTYTLYGDFEAKFKGLKHLWVHFADRVPESIELYEAYSNRECLHCHAGARSFEESELHLDFRTDFDTGETSCLECHDLAHEVDSLADYGRWSEGESR